MRSRILESKNGIRAVHVSAPKEAGDMEAAKHTAKSLGRLMAWKVSHAGAGEEFSQYLTRAVWRREYPRVTYLLGISEAMEIMGQAYTQRVGINTKRAQ